MHKTFCPLTRLDDGTGCAFCLITDKHHFMSGIAHHSLEVIYDASGGAHAITGDHNSGTSRTFKVIDHLLMFSVCIHAYQLFKAQGVAAFI